jgi:hypothetical protein
LGITRTTKGMEEEDTSTRMGFFMKGIGTWEIKEE